MRTLVIHPQDRTTTFLEVIYRELQDDRTILTSDVSNSEIRRHIIENQKIYLLGHGTEYGLLSSFRKDYFDRLIVNSSHVQFLRDRRVIGVFCNANIFAEKYDLHGLFTGMIISEMSEAQDWGIATTQEELDRENILFAERLSHCLRTYPLEEIPQRMLELDESHSELTEFNYHSIFYYE